MYDGHDGTAFLFDVLYLISLLHTRFIIYLGFASDCALLSTAGWAADNIRRLTTLRATLQSIFIPKRMSY